MKTTKFRFRALVLLGTTAVLTGCEDGLDAGSYFAADQRAAEVACECYAYEGYGSRSSCEGAITDLPSEGQLHCVDDALARFGNAAHVAFACERDVIAEFTACREDVRSCGSNALGDCDELAGRGFDACPEFPAGFIDAVDQCL